MRRRFKTALVTLSLAGAVAGGATAIASAASGSSSKPTATTPSNNSAPMYGNSAQTGPSGSSHSGNCPNM